MKKFLKIAVVLMAVFAMTNFIACSTGSDPVGTGSSSEAGGETGGTGSGGTGGSGSGETGGSGSGGGSSEKPETGGSGSGGGSSDKPGVVGEYKVVYAGETYMHMEGLTLEEATAMVTEFGLVENTDYTINNETKIITLTASGKEKVEAAMGGDPGAGTDPSDPGAGGVEVTFPLSADFTALAAESITAQINTANKALLVDEGVFVDANSQIPLIAVKAGTKVGTTQGTPTFNYADAKGIMVKRDGLYVPTSKLGKTVKVTVTAYMNSTSARNLELTAGRTGTTVTTAAPLTQGAMTPVDITVPAGEDLYIGASNELYISSIVIAVAE